MSLDIRAYAREHRLRLRNLHDGRPVPPFRPAKANSRAGYTGIADRWDAFIGRRGYIALVGNKLS
ncbi:MAG: hypothetical protein AB1716_04845, partial [Planctomycetota bacterium]